MIRFKRSEEAESQIDTSSVQLHDQDTPLYDSKETFQANISRLTRELSVDSTQEGLTLLAALKHKRDALDLQAYLTPDGFLSFEDPSDEFSAMILAMRLRDEPPVLKLEGEQIRVKEQQQKGIMKIKEEPLKEDQDTDTECDEEDDENVIMKIKEDLRKKVSEAIENQIQFVRDELPNRQYCGVEELQREVVDKLNSFTEREGLPHFFEHNGLEKPKYLSVKCRGCEHSSYLWFEKLTSPTGETILKFVRAPYGINMHKNISGHLPRNLKTHFRERKQSKSKF